MGIARQIDEIIARRKGRLPLIRKKLEDMDKVLEVLSDLDYMKNQMVDSEGKAKEEGKYRELLRKNPDMAWRTAGLDLESCKKAVKEAARELEMCRQRFERDCISISVVGEARRGKSTLLKSISGLNDMVIPAFESTDCTGAPSVICNRPGHSLKASLTFKSKEQMRQMAQVYLDRLIPDESRRITLRRMEDIRDLDMDEVMSRTSKGDPDGIYRRYLEKMVTSYDEWNEYPGRQEPLVLYKEEEIAPFVAQNNGIPLGEPGWEEYYRYLAVETCEITCSFPQEDAGKINLIDTVGLGNHTVGILENMLKTIREKSDGVIFMIMPQNGAGGGIPKPIKDIYRQIVESSGEKEPDKWLFYLINHVDSGSQVYAPNGKFCRSALEMLRSSGYFGSESARIINALDENAVRNDFLVPLLESLTENLEDIDRIYIRQAEECFARAKTEYGLLCSGVQKVLQSDIRSDGGMLPLLNQLTREAKDTMRARLFEQKNRWIEKRNEPCPVIYDSAADILDRMVQDTRKDGYLPSQEEILEQLNTGIQPATLYTQYANEIRNAISGDFLGINVQLKQFVDEMKDDMARVLCRECGLETLYRPQEGRPLHQWMEEFSKDVLGDDKTYRNIKMAIDTLCGFEFSVKGFLTYEVRNCLDLLDPGIKNIPILVAKNGSLKGTAANIRIKLLQCLCDIADTLEKVLKELCVKPNRALFAEAAEFYDRMIYAEGVDMEWNNFYGDKAAILWGGRMREQQSISILCQDWMEIGDKMQGFQRDGVFSFYGGEERV